MLILAMSPEELTTWVSTIAACILMIASVGLTIYQRIEQARFDDHKRWVELHGENSNSQSGARKRTKPKAVKRDPELDE